MKLLNINYWVTHYQILRQNGDFKYADELREMLRRIGYEIRVTGKNRKLVVVEK